MPTPPVHRPDPIGAPSRHAAALERALGAPLAEGNRVHVLPDGHATYRAMFEAIDAARDHINIENCTLDAEGPVQELARRLVNKRRQGVKVNLLFDHAGSWSTHSRFLDALREAGVQTCCRSPQVRGLKALVGRGIRPSRRRRLLIVDGKVALIGGTDIADVPSHGASARDRWPAHRTPRREAVRVEGPVVARLQQLFLDHWLARAGQQPYLSHFFPRLPFAGGHRAGVAACAGGERPNPFYTALLHAVDLAQERICIAAARFVPPRRLLHALLRAAGRGVAVDLLLPSVGDSWAALHAGRSHYGRLLKAGVRVHEHQGAPLHGKMAVIDGAWAAVGAGNLDRRAMQHDADAHLVVVDRRFGAELESAFADDLRHSAEITLAQWLRRGRGRRLLEAVARRLEFLL